MTRPPLTIEDVHGAARRLLNRVHHTPVIASTSFDETSGYSVFFKCENLQRAGSFKIRGALNKLLTLSPAERSRGVVTVSSGNHGQALALAARLTDTTAVVCMPSDTPFLKVQATRGYGAEVVFYDRQKEDPETVAGRVAEEAGRVPVPPYDDYAVMAGQGTAALELFEDVPSLDVLVAPISGGGLMAGASAVARGLFPGMAIIGVEPEAANDTYLSLQKGERVTIPPPTTIADDARATTPGARTFPLLRENLTDIGLVSDEEIRVAVRFLALRTRVVVEPSGAVAAAAVLHGKLPVQRGARVGVILSGGNIEPQMLVDILQAT